MRLFKNSALVLLSMGTLASCDGMDVTYKESIEKGPIVYIGKVGSPEAYAGRSRAMSEWQKLFGSCVKTAKVFWEDRTRSTELQLTDKADLTQAMVKGLAEGSYVLEAYTYDTHGNSSIMPEVSCTVYGDVYEKPLFNARIKAAVLKNDVLTITFVASLEPTFPGSEVTCMSIDGGSKTVILRTPKTQVKIDDSAGDRIIYRSVYLLGETAIDYSYNESNELEIK